MHRLRPTLITLALLAGATTLPAGPAVAKGLTGLAVCGAHGCVDRSDRLGGDGGRALLEAGATVADPGRAPYVRLKLHLGDGGKTFSIATVVFLPRSGLQRLDDGTWHRTDAASLARLRRIARGVAPLPASTLRPFEPAPGPPIPEALPAPHPSPATATAQTGHGAATAAVAGGVALLALLAAGAARTQRRRRPGRPAIG
jgi:hypothetical protein